MTQSCTVKHNKLIFRFHVILENVKV